MPTWVAWLALCREVLVAIAALLLAALGLENEVTWWGKTGTFLFMFAFPFFLAGESEVFLALFGRRRWVCVVTGLPILLVRLCMSCGSRALLGVELGEA